MPTETYNIPHRYSANAVWTGEIDFPEGATEGQKLGLAVKAAVNDGASLRNASLVGAILDGASLRNAILDGASLRNASLRNASLDGASLRNASLVGAILDGASLRNASLVGAILDGASLRNASLDGASLDGASLRNASLDGASLPDETLRPFKADFFLTLSTLRAGQIEVEHLIAKLQSGQVDGGTYGKPGMECACLVGTIAQPRAVHGDSLDHNSGRPAERWFMMIKPGDLPTNETGGGFAAKKALEWAVEWRDLHGFASQQPVIS